MLGVAIATLHAWRRGGKPSAFIRLGRAVRYRLSDLRELIRQGGYANRRGGGEDAPMRAKETGLPAVNSPILFDFSEQLSARAASPHRWSRRPPPASRA